MFCNFSNDISLMSVKGGMEYSVYNLSCFCGKFACQDMEWNDYQMLLYYINSAVGLYLSVYYLLLCIFASMAARAVAAAEPVCLFMAL